MQRLGYIHDMMDVKVLILYVMARSEYPLTVQEIYELCYQDDCLSYFDVCTGIPEMVKSGHLQERADGKYEITEKGREDGALTADSIAFTVKQRAESAVARYNRQMRRSSYVRTQISQRDKGDYSVVLVLDDDGGNIMTLEMMAPDRTQAVRLSKLMEQKAEFLYDLTLTALLDEEIEEE